MTWVYLSPHMDDIALSCGGLLWEQSRAGQDVSIWTICAGDPPAGPLSAFALELHTRWQTGPLAPVQRRAEDAASAGVLGANLFQFSLSDCIYRVSAGGVAMYDSARAIFEAIHPHEADLPGRLADEMARKLPGDARLVCPLALGGHVDHRLTRAAAELLGRPLWYYADYPYVQWDSQPLTAAQDSGWRAEVFDLSPAGLAAWADSIAAHRSQISSFWPDLEAMQRDISQYAGSPPVVRLWRPPED